MDKKLGGIYAITSKKNGKRYIGSAVCFKKRWYQHINSLKANKHHSIHLQKHFNKYGLDDLVFSIVEVVDRDIENLSIKEYRDRLLNVEQTYLDNWSHCKFNSKQTAVYNGSNAGQKYSKAKYYTYNKRYGKYSTFFVVDEKHINFGFHDLEEDAIKQVEYLKTLTTEQLLDYKKQSSVKTRVSRNRGSRYYYREKKTGKWIVSFIIKNKTVLFGRFALEEDAVDEVEYLKTLSDDDKLNYKESCLLGIHRKKIGVVPDTVQPIYTETFVEKKIENSNIYYYKRKADLFAVVNNNEPELYFKTLQEAKQKVAELKGEPIPTDTKNEVISTEITETEYKPIVEYNMDDFVDKVWAAYKHKKAHR